MDFEIYFAKGIFCQHHNVRLSRDQIYYIPLHAPLRSIKGHFYSSVILPVLAVVILQGILVFKKYLKWC